MPASRLDQLARTLATAGTRRGLTRLLLGGPVLAGLLAHLGMELVTAADDDHGSSHRRRRRGTRHKHRTNTVRRNKKHKPNKRHTRNTPNTPIPPAPPVPGCTGLQPSDDLQAAIDGADAGATLTLCAGTWALPATVLINKNLTVRGAGAGQSILDGQHAVRVLHIPLSSANVTLHALTIRNGVAVGDVGGGIRNYGTLTLAAVTVTGNTGGNGGGGIANFAGGTVTLQNGSRIMGNSVVVDGGGIWNQGTLILAAGSIVGGDTPADANTAQEGGGILNVFGGTMTLQDGSRVTGNTPATRVGGGIRNQFGGTVTLQDGSRVTGNTATLAGGGIATTGTLTVAPAALVCNNTQPTGSQCFGDPPTPGSTCPNPASGVCP